MKKLFKQHNYKLPMWRHSKINCKAFSMFLKSKNISPIIAAKILNRLNSLDSAVQLENTILERTRERTLSTKDAQRILDSRVELGEFQNLQQVAAVSRIGSKKLDSIVNALSN